MRVEVIEVIDHRDGARYYWVSYGGKTEIFSDKQHAFERAEVISVLNNVSAVTYNQGQDRR